MIITITIIPAAYTPAMTTTPATIHRIPMIAEDAVVEVIVEAVEAVEAVEGGVMEAAAAVEGID